MKNVIISICILMLILDKFSQNMTQYGRGKWLWNKMKMNSMISIKECTYIKNKSCMEFDHASKRTEMR